MRSPNLIMLLAAAAAVALLCVAVWSYCRILFVWLAPTPASEFVFLGALAFWPLFNALLLGKAVIELRAARESWWIRALSVRIQIHLIQASAVPVVLGGWPLMRDAGVSLAFLFVVGSLALAIAAAWMFGWHKRFELRAQARTRDGLPVCTQCGYDLTANTSGTCPECGNAAESKVGQ